MHQGPPIWRALIVSVLISEMFQVIGKGNSGPQARVGLRFAKLGCYRQHTGPAINVVVVFLIIDRWSAANLGRSLFYIHDDDCGRLQFLFGIAPYVIPSVGKQVIEHLVQGFLLFVAVGDFPRLTESHGAAVIGAVVEW